MKIEFGEFRANELMKQHVMDCLDSGWVSIGKKTQLFEEKFANLFGYKFCKAVSSGTSAGIAACMSLYEIKNAQINDEIICPALSFIATANAIKAANFCPKFVDVDYDMNIDVDQVEQAITSRTKAIKAVSLMGKPPKLDRLKDIANKYNLLLIVDNCEGTGNKFNGKHALCYADVETSSHYVGHLLVGAEGGTCTTNDEQIDDVIKSVRSHGRVGSSLFFDHVRYGLNLKPSDIHSSLLLGSVDNFWEIFNKRRSNYKFIRNKMNGLEDVAWFTEEDQNDQNCPHGFSITFKPKYKHHLDDFKLHLNNCSIHWKRNFGSMPDHKAFEHLGETGRYPVSTYIGNYGIHIGCHFYLTNEDLEYLTSSITEFLAKLL